MDSPIARIGHVNLAAGFRGGERQTQLLVQGLAELGWRQKLFARRGEPLAERCRGIPGLTVVETSASVVSAAKAMSDVELIHVHQGRALKAAFLNHLLRHTPYLVTRRIQKGPRATGLNRRMYRRAGAVAVVSAAIGESVRRLDSQLPTVLIPDSTSQLSADTSVAAGIRSRLSGGFLVGHVGALDDSHKGQMQIIEMAKRLTSVSFLLVGSGRDEQRLKEAAAGLSNPWFAGQVDNVGDHLAAFDLFIYPSRHEGLGSVILDAMAAGLPVVATQVGGIPDIVEHSINGFLCVPDDLDALCDAVAELQGNNELREKIGASNRKKAEQYSPQVMTNRYAELYERLIP